METKRKFENWLDSFLIYTKDMESPENFKLWTGISILSATMQKNVWSQFGIDKLYPNQYIFLIAANNRIPMGNLLVTAQYFIAQIISYSRLPLIGALVTLRALINSLQQHKNRYLFNNLDLTNLSIQNFLCEIYSCPDSWEQISFCGNDPQLENISLNLLNTLSNQDFKDIFPTSDQPCLLNRLILIRNDLKIKAIPELNLFITNDQLRKDLIHDLKVISELKGVFAFNIAASKIYQNFYNSNFLKVRYSQHLLKVSMALQVSQGNKLEFTKNTLTQSNKYLQDSYATKM